MSVDSVNVVGPLCLSLDLGSDYGSNAVEIQSLKPGESLETLDETGSLPTNEPTNLATNKKTRKKKRGKKRRRKPLPITNGTTSSLVAFEGFIPKEWLCSSNEVLQVLERQLKFCGGFCQEMKKLDFSTPANVRIRSTKLTIVQMMLKEKTSLSVIKSVENLILPNIQVLKSGSMVKKVLEGFCQALGDSTTETTIKELSLYYDRISTKFVAGNLNWIEDLFTHHQIEQISVS